MAGICHPAEHHTHHFKLVAAASLRAAKFRCRNVWGWIPWGDGPAPTAPGFLLLLLGKLGHAHNGRPMHRTPRCITKHNTEWQLPCTTSWHRATTAMQHGSTFTTYTHILLSSPLLHSRLACCSLQRRPGPPSPAQSQARSPALCSGQVGCPSHHQRELGKTWR